MSTARVEYDGFICPRGHADPSARWDGVRARCLECGESTRLGFLVFGGGPAQEAPAESDELHEALVVRWGGVWDAVIAEGMAIVGRLCGDEIHSMAVRLEDPVGLDAVVEQAGCLVDAW